MKKTNRRNSCKFPGLYPQYNLISRKELFENDYIQKLNNDEKAWLNSFNEEWNSANFSHPGECFHKTPEERKIIWARNNARNFDLYTTAKARGKLSYFDDLSRTQAAIIGTDIIDEDETFVEQVFDELAE